MNLTQVVIQFLAIQLLFGQSDIDWITGPIASGKDCENHAPSKPFVVSTSVRRSGNDSLGQLDARDLNLNWLSIKNYRIELLSLFQDYFGCIPLRHVPSLPKVEALLLIKTRAEMLIMLGRPLASGWQDTTIDEWGFFAIESGVLRIILVRIVYDKASGKLDLIEVETGQNADTVPHDHDKVTDEPSPSSKGESPNNRRSAPHQPPEGPPPAKPGSAPK